MLEWIIAFVFSAYILSFYVDLYPAAKTKQQRLELATAAGNGKEAVPQMRLARGREPALAPVPPTTASSSWRYDVSADMERYASEGTLSTEPTVVANGGRRSGSRNRVMARNF